MQRHLLSVLAAVALAACGTRTPETSTADTTAPETAGAETTAPSAAVPSIHVGAEGRAWELAHGYAVPQPDGTTLIALSSVELSCGYLAFLGAGTPAPQDGGVDYEIFYTRALPWAVGEHADVQLLGIAVREGSMGGASSDHTDVSVLAAPAEVGARGRVRAHAAGDPNWAFVPSMDGEVDVEVCAP